MKNIVENIGLSKDVLIVLAFEASITSLSFTVLHIIY